MLLNYFVVDTDQQLRRVEREAVEEVWEGVSTADSLPNRVGEELRILSVLCDEEELQPQTCFFVKADLQDGQITAESRSEAYDAMSAHQQQPDEQALPASQFAGWPVDWQTQLAVALDVPAIRFRQVGVGGPLLMADLWGFSIDQILGYFDEASQERESDA